MAYSIGYGTQRQERLTKRRSNPGLLAAGFFLIFLFGVQLFWEDGAQAIRQLVFPLQDQAMEALEGMVQSIRGGASIPDAVSAFCLEVMESAALP